MSVLAQTICFIACHGASADHFALFAENLIHEGYEVHVYASEGVVKKFQDRQIPSISFNKENLTPNETEALATHLAKQCTDASSVVTDVGHPFDQTVQNALAKEAPKVLRFAYYDNPESFVPGGYSKVAAGVMLAAQRVLFANANLAEAAELDLPLKKRVGLGYYPLAPAEKIAARRKEGSNIREKLFQKYHLTDQGQKVLVYFGGNNEEYFGEAFPAFCRFLSEAIETADLSNLVIFLQQHPGAKAKNIDRQALEAWILKEGNNPNAPQVLISEETTDDMQVLTDGALYYQTSMGPQFILAGIPCLQVGHKTYPDVIVRGGLCPSVTDSKAFVEQVLKTQPIEVTDEKRNAIYKSLGIRDDWFQVLKKALTP